MLKDNIYYKNKFLGNFTIHKHFLKLQKFIIRLVSCLACRDIVLDDVYENYKCIDT